MKKIPQKTLNRLDKLKAQTDVLNRDFQNDIWALQKKYNITDKHFDYDYDNWVQNDYDFQDDFAELYHEHDRKYQMALAQWAALFLIATNIARRGKPLHPDVAIQKLSKMGNSRTTMTITDMIDMPVLRPMVGDSEPFLANELYYTYGVVLMDSYLANRVKQKITHYSAIPWQQKKAQHYKNFLKKFHKSVLAPKFDQREYEPF